MLIEDRLIVFNMSSIFVSHHPGLYLLTGHSDVVFVIIKDTITENKILARVFESSITERIINDTLFLAELPKRQMFIGFQMGLDKKDIFNYGGLSLLYKDKILIFIIVL